MPEYAIICDACSQNNLTLINVLSPHNKKERLMRMSQSAGELVYLPGRKGITGLDASLQDALENEITKVNDYLNAAVAVGFGIRNSADIATLKDARADVAVIGSALLKSIDPNNIEQSIESFLKPIISSLPH